MRRILTTMLPVVLPQKCRETKIRPRKMPAKILTFHHPLHTLLELVVVVQHQRNFLRTNLVSSLVSAATALELVRTNWVSRQRHHCMYFVIQRFWSFWPLFFCSTLRMVLFCHLSCKRLLLGMAVVES